MQPYAEASCVLKVNVHCPACKMSMLEVLGSICGKYNVDIDAEEGLVRVYAMVDPNLLLRALARTGYHAELKWAKLRHPALTSYHGDTYQDPYGHRYYGAIGDGYAYRRGLSDPNSNGYPYMMGPVSYRSGLQPEARYVPSYPPVEYDAYGYDDEANSLCSIM